MAQHSHPAQRPPAGRLTTMRRAVPLSVQLLLTCVGLLFGLAVVLTSAAYTSLLASLEADANRQVTLAALTREQTLSQLFELRQQRALGFLSSIESLCSESDGPRRLAWVDECVRPMVDDFRQSEGALGAVLTYRDRPVRRSGRRVSAETPDPGALAKVVRTVDGSFEYVMKVRRSDTALILQFDHRAVASLFDDRRSFGRTADVFLLDHTGHFLTPSRYRPPNTSDQLASRLAHCRSGADGFIDVESSAVKSFQSYRPLAALGSACVGARLEYDDAIAPAEHLRGALARRAGWFVFVGVVLSLFAAHWISAPVRRLAQSARTLQTGRFEHSIPLGGPSEVRALGRAFNAMANDLTELVAKEQAARREAEDASRAKDEFIATVSHELRTPLTAVLGWAAILQDGDTSPERLHHGLEVIERSARAQSRLIDDLLDVSRIVSNRLRMVREPVSLAAVIESALDSVRPQADAKGVEIHTDLAESALVLADPRRLEQVICNLVWNAIKFTEPPGHVRIQLKRVDRNLLVSITDTGVGISSSFLPYVFDWFRQEDARSRSQSGLGLGLGIVRHIVQLHGGTVRADSPGAGQGTTMTVTLPVHQPATRALPRAAAERPRPVLAHALNAARVLVVEDDEDARELVKTTLESAGAQVDAVASARDARREMFADAPDVLVSDVRMPVEDGYSLIRSLRSAGIATPAIALTAYARREDADEARNAGFQIHLPKPVDAGRLVDAVASLLQNHSVH
jgi:signal transduction histidine kinase/ActR/RegA family two-component response regulator